MPKNKVFGQAVGGRRKRRQKSTTCSEDISVMEFYLSVLALQLRWSILFIFCLLAPEGMNEIVFGKRDGEGDRRLWLILILSP